MITNSPGKARDPGVNWVNWVQLIFILGFSPLFIFPRLHLWWVFLVIPVLWIMRKLIIGEFLETTPLDLPLGIILIAVAASAFKTPDITHSLPKISGVLLAVALFYAITALLKTGKLLKWGTGIFLLGGFLFSLIGLAGMPTFTEKHMTLLQKIKDALPRINFGFEGAETGFAPTVVGGILLLVIPLFFMMLLHAWKTKELKKRTVIIVLSCAGLAVTGFVLLLTQARGAWAGLFVSTLIIGLIALVRVMKRKKIYGTVIAVLVIVSIVVGIAVVSASKADQLKPGLKQAEGTLLFRVQLWDLALPVIKDNPLFGLGLNNFRQIPEVRYFLSHPHNQLLDVAVELGIPAMLAFMALLILVGYMCVRILRISKDQWMRRTITGLGWGQAAHALFCITDAIPPGAKVGILFWISCALITSIYLNAAKGKVND